ncbi:MAG: hypothetical protein ACRENI_09420 [Gemmatimonadaceae bacterium]
MNRTAASALLACCLLAPSLALPIAAQDASGSTLFASQFAVTNTPIGALPPVVSREMMASLAQGFSFRIQYGYLGQEGAFNNDNFGIGFDIPTGRGTIGLTAGYTMRDCPDDIDCSGNVMAGLSWERRLTGLSIGAGAEAAGITLGIDGVLGVAKPDEDTFTPGLTLFSAGMGLPIAVNAGSGRIRFHPFLVPRFTWGRVTSDNGGDSGAGFMIGGGLGISGISPALTVNIGFQKYMTVFSNAQFGVGVSIAPRG